MKARCADSDLQLQHSGRQRQDDCHKLEAVLSQKGIATEKAEGKTLRWGMLGVFQEEPGVWRLEQREQEQAAAREQEAYGCGEGASRQRPCCPQQKGLCFH